MRFLSFLLDLFRHPLQHGSEPIPPQAVDPFRLNSPGSLLLVGHAALRQQNSKALEAVFEQGLNPNQTLLHFGDQGKTFLTLLLSLPSNNRRRCFKVIHRFAPDYNLPDATGRSPLHAAIQIENPLYTRFLLLQHVQADPQDDRGNTPLHLAIDHLHSHVDYELYLRRMRLLVQAGAYIHQENRTGETPG